MNSISNTDWIWSQDHKRYYAQVHEDGRWVTIWENLEKHGTTRDQDISNAMRIRNDSGNFSYGQDSCQLPPESSSGHSKLKTFAESQAPINTAPKDPFSQYQPIPSPINSRGVGKTFAGDYYPGNTARNIHYEELDPTFFVRSPSFFQVGKVFAIILIEEAGSTTTDYDSSITTVRFGIRVHSQVRRFVVIKNNKEFCYACPIFTYGGRGLLKPGVRPDEHAIIYTQGCSPRLLNGESGITKAPIMVVQDQKIPPLQAASRLNFGIHHPIQYNVKVKDLGYVAETDLPRLRGYWAMSNPDTGVETTSMKTTDVSMSDMEISEEEEASDEDSSDGEAGNMEITNMQTTRLIEPVSSQAVDLSTTTNDGRISTVARRSPESKPLLEQDISLSIVERLKRLRQTVHLDPAYEFVSNPKAFFKKGRVFMTLWTEPWGYSQAEKETNTMVEQAFTQIARFAVVRTRGTHCLCLRIRTYSGKATTKPGTVVQDHAAVVGVGGDVQLHPGEELLTKTPICVKVEDASLSIDPMSRMNFTKVYTVEYNLKIRNVGRVFGESVGIMDEYFAAGLGLIKA